jgi:hypothetical protein
MLYLVTGASGSGKTASLSKLRELKPDISWHDFDDVGVPTKPAKIWRQRTTQFWIEKAIENHANGHDTGVTGSVILGEALACPSALEVDGIAACLLDCYDVVRIDRFRLRGTHGDTQDMLCWAAWQRMHAVDPQWRTDVIREGSAPEMRWERWENWQRGDPRGQVYVIDTTAITIEEVALGISRWIERSERQAHPNRAN